MTRKILLRLCALGFGLLILVVIEVSLRILGIAGPEVTVDPLVGFDSIEPLFVRTGDQFEIPKSRHEFFRPESFPSEKAENERRIFCLGGSTVQGRPFATETSFTRWLQINLNVGDTRYRWRVINCGGVSYASYRLIPILQEVMSYRPDYILIYTGHNEFLEDRSYSAIKAMPAWTKALYRGVFQLRTARWLWRLRHGQQTNTPLTQESLTTEVDALLDYQDGLKYYHFDPAWRESVIGHFQLNIARMLAICHAHDVPVMVFNPVARLKDCPPFKVSNDTRLSDETLHRFVTHQGQARAPGVKPEERIRHLRAATELDAEHAGAQYLLGSTLLAQQRVNEGRARLMLAKDADICPLRILESMRLILRQACRSRRVPLLDIDAEFARQSPQGMVGEEWLVDHVHPSIRGHQLIADLVTARMGKLTWAALADDWKARSRPAQQKHLKSLDELYFQHAKIRLEGLTRWSKGRGTKIRKK